jgi:hypothetical protein
MENHPLFERNNKTLTLDEYRQISMKRALVINNEHFYHMEGKDFFGVWGAIVILFSRRVFQPARSSVKIYNSNDGIRSKFCSETRFRYVILLNGWLNKLFFKY